MLLLGLMIAAEEAPAFGTPEVIGPYGALVLALLVIGGLLKDRAAERADKDRVIAQRDDMITQLVASERQTATTLATVGPILEAVTQELRLARERTG